MPDEAIAGADGLLIANEVDEGDVDLIEMFDMHANALYSTALRLLTENAEQ